MQQTMKKNYETGGLRSPDLKTYYKGNECFSLNFKNHVSLPRVMF